MPMDLPTHCCLTMASTGGGNCGTRWGGNDRAPKFPIPTNLDFLLHYGTVRSDQAALDPPEHAPPHGARWYPRPHRRRIRTLQRGRKMARAPLRKNAVRQRPARRYVCPGVASIARSAGDERAALQRAALGIVDFVQREWSHASGGFYSALDADSDGVEGKYYVWTAEERSLTEEEYRLCEQAFGGWEERLGRVRIGGYSQCAHEVGVRQVNSTSLDRERKPSERNWRLFMQNLGPLHGASLLDDKVLTAWTALMASAQRPAPFSIGPRTSNGRGKRWIHPRLSVRWSAATRLTNTGPRIDAVGRLWSPSPPASISTKPRLKRGTPSPPLNWQNRPLLIFTIRPTAHLVQRMSGEALFARKQENDDSVVRAQWREPLPTITFSIGQIGG